MDAIITAGGRTRPDDPLSPYVPNGNKALLDIAGKPMIQWVLDAVGNAQSVGRVVVVGLPQPVGADDSRPGSPQSYGLTCAKPVDFLPDHGSLLENIQAGVRHAVARNPASRYVFSVSADIPALTGEMLDWVADTAMQTEDDVYYHVIKREVMEARFPTSKRSYVHLRDMDMCGGDVGVIRCEVVTSNEALWRRVIEARKSALKQAGLLGYDTLILLLLRLLTLEGAVRRASRSLRVRGRGVVCPYAEIGMDVDKPHQLEILRADLARRAAP